jgi:hypothetical protein
MKRTWLLLLVAAIPLLGASIGLAPPIVVVYPLTATGSVGSADTGANIATALANKLASLGDVTVKPFVSGTTRQQFLTAALSQGADYYITGYLTPLGSEVSVVEQVVSTRSGSIVYSTTAFARTYADAIGPADNLREAILHHAGRGMASLDAPPPSPSPEALGSGGGVNISKAFGHRRKAAPTATTAAAATAVAVTASPGSSGLQARGPTTSASPGTAVPSPTSRVALAAPAAQAPTGSRQLIITTAGTADSTARNYASKALSSALYSKGIANSLLGVDASDVAAHGRDLCNASAATGFYAASLAIAPAAGKHARGPTARLDVVAYDCRGTATARESGAASAGHHGSVQSAIDAAAATVASALAKTSR